MRSSFPHPVRVAEHSISIWSMAWSFFCSPDVIHLPAESKVCREMEKMGNKKLLALLDPNSH